MGVLMVAAVIIQSISTTMLVKLEWISVNMIPLMVFSVTAVDATLACVVCLGGMAGVFTESTQVMCKLKRHLCSLYLQHSKKREEARWQRRFLRSCTLIKIRFGGFNYVDQLTPVNCMNFANSLTVQLLLLGL